MKIKIYNKSLSARIRRRNKCGFAGTGNWGQYDKKGNLISYSSVKAAEGRMGNYLDEIQNHKLKDRRENMAVKSKVGFTPDVLKVDEQGRVYRAHKRKNRCMSKRYADNHQKL